MDKLTHDDTASHLAPSGERGVPQFRLERALTTAAEAGGGACLFGLLLVLVFSILARDVLAIPTPWLEEIATLLAVYAVALGSIGAWSRGAHIAIEILPMMLGPRSNAVLRVVILLISLAFLITAASGALEMMQRSAFNRTTALGLSFSWYYAGLLLAFAGMALMIMLRVMAMIHSALTTRSP